MKPSSAKNKGRKFQQAIRDDILDFFPELEKDDVRSTSMGAGGEDILLSPKARHVLPITVECKHHAKFSIYGIYEQAKEHAVDRPGVEPVCVIKQNGDRPLAVVDWEFFLHLMRIKSYG